MDQSLKDLLQGEVTRTLAGKTQDLPIPGFGGRLWGTFRALDAYQDMRDAATIRDAGGSESEGELLMAAKLIVDASITTFGRTPEGDVPIGLPIGKALAAEMDLQVGANEQGLMVSRPASDEASRPPENDTQAVWAIFVDGTASIGMFATKLKGFVADAIEQARETAAGNSGAPS